jgi:hypothetical protein
MMGAKLPDIIVMLLLIPLTVEFKEAYDELMEDTLD